MSADPDFADFAGKVGKSSTNNVSADNAVTDDDFAARRTAGETDTEPDRFDSKVFDLASFVPKTKSDKGDEEKEPVHDRAWRKQQRALRHAEEAAQPLPKRILRFVFNFIVSVICIGIITGAVVATLISIYVVDVTKYDGDLLDENKVQLSYTTILYAKDESGTYYDSQRLVGDENRVWISYSEMPDYLINAVVAVEDQRFWTHSGVDWKRTFAAFINEYLLPIFGNTQGGSTITQQVIKNITSDNSTDSISGALRKIREIYRAIMLENQHSKEEILEAYLNTFRLSGQLAGVEAAAKEYFNCTTQELNVAQCAAIICVTNAPTKYNPLTNPDANKERREYVLYTMHEQGYLTDDEYAEALQQSEDMVFTNTLIDGQLAIPQTEETETTVYSYFTDMVINDVINDLVEINGMTDGEAWNMVFNGGLRIYTTMEKLCQDTYNSLMLDDMFSTVLDEYGERPQAALITLNTEGEVVGVMGGVGEKTQSRTLNRAVDSLRSIGSSMKPIGVYGPAIEINAITFSTLFPDTPLQVSESGGISNWPVNFSHSYGGPITVAYAIAQSINTVAVRCLQLIGFEYSYAFLTTRLGISTLDETLDKSYSPLALGGLTNGISMRELCAAYVPFSNGGTYYEPHSYTKITDYEGKIILDKTRNIKIVKAFADDSAMIMNKLLQGVMNGGTGIAARYGNMPLAGKSGTTSDDYDYLFVGMNPYYVTVTWLGYDIPGKLPSKYASRNSFKYVMSAISAPLEYKTFPVASNVVSAAYCTVTGDLAGGGCGSTGTGWYKSDHLPPTCNHSYYG